jgi:hypothetical protein
MGQRIRSSVQVILDAVEQACGEKVAAADFLEALLSRVEAAGITERRLVVAIGYRRLLRSHAAALNISLAQRVARWGLHALGPDAPLRESYPLYRALAYARGLSPWGFPWYQANAFGRRGSGKAFMPKEV